MPSVAGQPLISADITMPAVGAWHAETSSDGTEALSGQVTIEVQGIEFTGTVIRSGVNGGRVSSRIVGGAGKLTAELAARNYTGPRVAVVLADIIRESGETLSGSAEAAVTGRSLSKWHRSKGPASHALVTLLDAVQATWRVERGGAIWVGAQTWPEAAPGEYVLIDEDWAGGFTTIAPEAPALLPGTTFRGQRIEQVIHRLTSGALRTEAWLTSPAGSLQRFLGHIRRSIDYSRAYPCRVSRQNADGTLQLVPDDATMRGSGLDKVQIRYPAPGQELKVANGARCTLEFEGGDPARPIVTGWDSGAITELKVVPSGLPAGRQGDMVAVTIMAIPVAPSGGFMLPPPGPLPVGAVPITAYGVISSGNTIVKT